MKPRLAGTDRKCPGCKKVKPIGEFNQAIGTTGEYWSHFYTYCKPCSKAKAKKSYYAKLTTEELASLERKTITNLSQIRAELAKRV